MNAKEKLALLEAHMEACVDAIERCVAKPPLPPELQDLKGVDLRGLSLWYVDFADGKRLECTATFSDSCDRQIVLNAKEYGRVEAALGDGYKGDERGWLFSDGGAVCEHCTRIICRMEATRDN